jgi:hypothetical protein
MERITLIVRPGKSGSIELPDNLTAEDIEIIWEQLRGLGIYHKAMARARSLRTTAKGDGDGMDNSAPTAG